MADTPRLHPATRAQATAAVPFLDVLIRSGIVALTIATGAIHLPLGGLLFTMNGLGYFVAAVAMVIPLAIANRFRWLVRLGLIGYADDDRRLVPDGSPLRDRLHRQRRSRSVSSPSSRSTSPAATATPWS